MVVRDLKPGDRYRYTKELIEKQPWLARGVYTHCGDHATYEHSPDDTFKGVDVVAYGGPICGHLSCEVELVKD